MSVVARTPKGWDAHEARGSEDVVLSNPDVRFAVDALYDDVTLE